MSIRPFKMLAAATLLLSVTATLQADRQVPSGERVELFAAIEAKQVEVKLIPKNAEQATVIVRNKTNRPLSIRMPEAFAGLPVLAQNIDGGGGRGGGLGGGGGGGNQGFGGGMGGGGMGGGGMGGMGGFFNVGPERVGKVKVATVCLEHGKEDPNPRVAYEMKPIESLTKKPALIEVCRMLGRKEIDQTSAQAAAWHLSDDLSWDALARKVKVKHLNGQQTMYFNTHHLRKAVQAVQVARHRADEKASPGEESPGEKSPGDSLSE